MESPAQAGAIILDRFDNSQAYWRKILVAALQDALTRAHKKGHLFLVLAVDVSHPFFALHSVSYEFRTEALVEYDRFRDDHMGTHATYLIDCRIGKLTPRATRNIDLALTP
jgi:hypothetical protein